MIWWSIGSYIINNISRINYRKCTLTNIKNTQSGATFTMTRAASMSGPLQSNGPTIRSRKKERIIRKWISHVRVYLTTCWMAWYGVGYNMSYLLKMSYLSIKILQMIMRQKNLFLLLNWNNLSKVLSSHRSLHLSSHRSLHLSLHRNSSIYRIVIQRYPNKVASTWKQHNSSNTLLWESLKGA